MAGTFDNAVSFVELSLPSTITGAGTLGYTAATSAAYVFPYDIEIVSAAISGQVAGNAPATVFATTGVVVNLTTATAVGAVMTAPANLLWSTTGTAQSSAITSIRVDQGVVTVYCTTATASLATGLASADLVGKEITLSGIAEVGTSVLTAGLIAALNGPQVVTSNVLGNGGLANTTGTAIIGFTFGPLKQAAFYNTSNGFWNFTIPSVQATGLAVVTEQPYMFLATGTTAPSAVFSDLGFSPDLTKNYTRPDGSITQVSRGFVPAGTPITPVVKFVDNTWANVGVQTTAMASLNINLAVKKA
jgi:hypothetical protein